jgi:hypothetical protein
VFAAGYGEQVAFTPEFSDAPKLRKPYSIDALRGGRTLGQPVERDSGEQKRLQLFGTNETLGHNRRSATSSTRWLSTFLRMRSARWRVGKMFSLRLSRLMRVQIVTAVSTASSSDNVA